MMTALYAVLAILLFTVGWLMVQVRRLTRVIKVTREVGSETVRVGFDDNACLTVSRFKDRDSEIYMKTPF
jgi:hypothetical protein